MYYGGQARLIFPIAFRIYQTGVALIRFYQFSTDLKQHYIADHESLPQLAHDFIPDALISGEMPARALTP